MNTYFISVLVGLIILTSALMITSWGFVNVTIKSENK